MTDSASAVHRRLLLCSHCNIQTNHDVLCEYTGDTRWDEETEFGWSVRGTLLRCLGCDWPTLEVRHSDSDTRDQDGNYVDSIQLYPERVPPSDDLLEQSYLLIKEWSDLEIREWTTMLPSKVRSLYQETLLAIRNGIPVLAAAGLRAIVEAICLDKSVKGNNLQEKIDNLVVGGYLASGQAKFLHLHRLIGNEAVHELKTPERPVLIASLLILQNMLKTIYGLPRLADLVESERESQDQEG